MIEKKRHSYSHILAQAIKNIYWNVVKMWVWPDTENGFYYDFDFKDIDFSDKSLKDIQKEMKDIIKQDQKFVNFKLDAKEAIKLLEFIWEGYKIELANDLVESWEKQIGFYININDKLDPSKIDNIKQENKQSYLKLLQDVVSQFDLQEYTKDGLITFLDMCAWPHVESTWELDQKSFKVSHIAWAYWKGSEKNNMLTRVYSYAFNTKQELDDYISFLQEAKKRDHRLIWKKMDLFSFSDNVWLWLPLWHPMGMRLWKAIEDFWKKEHIKWWYEFVRTPHIWNQKLWETSWHWGFYSDSMYPPLEVGQTLEEAQEWKQAEISEKYLLKPMNCPFHAEIYKQSPKSYRQLPLRWAEIGTVYRYEKKWQLWGLTRVRWFSQDDAHIFCTKEQVKDEIIKVIDFIEHIIKSFDMEYKAFLSFRDPSSSKYVWKDEDWDISQSVLKEVAEKKKLNAVIEEWEAAFYGPKIDFQLKDCLGRSHQCSTVQFDFNLPERFDLSYKDKNGEEQRPYMIHRALLWSFERFMSILIEHFAWVFPLWLAPRQAIIIPVSEKFDSYARKINNQFLSSEIRSEIDFSSDSFSKKIRNAEKSHINYILIVWEDEENSNTVSVRNYKTKEQTKENLKDFEIRILKEIEDKV